MREIGILIIDGGILDMWRSCDKYEVLHFHPSLGFEDAQCEKPIYHATHLQHAARVEDPFWHRIQEAAVNPDRLDQGGQLWHGAQLPGPGRLRRVLRGSGEGPQRALHPEPGVGQWGWLWLRRDQRIRGPLWAADLVKLEKISELVSSCLSRKFRKEKLVYLSANINQQSVRHKSMK